MFRQVLFLICIGKPYLVVQTRRRPSQTTARLSRRGARRIGPSRTEYRQRAYDVY